MGGGLMPYYVRDGGTWKRASRVERRDGGVWKEPSREETRDGGAWKPAYAPELLVPDGDVGSSAWSDATGGDGDGALWDELDEDTPDFGTTYITGDIPGAGDFRVSLANPTKPHWDGQRHQVQARVRPHIDAGESDVEVTVEVYESSTLIASQTTTYTSGDDGNWFDPGFELTTAEVGGISNRDDLELRMNAASVDATVDARSVDCTWLTFRMD